VWAREEEEGGYICPCYIPTFSLSLDIGLILLKLYTCIPHPHSVIHTYRPSLTPIRLQKLFSILALKKDDFGEQQKNF